jgi:transcription initiation factor TFIIE subunit alpha
MIATKKAIDEAVAESAGEEVLPLVRILKKRKNVSEFKLAEQIKKEINITRNLLYRLYNANLVSFERIKDKKKGWYIYYWTFNIKKTKDLIRNQRREKLIRLKERFKKEENNKYYSCEEKCLRLDFERAFDFEFKCPECGKLLNEDDNTKRIQEIQKEINFLENIFAKTEKKKTSIKPKKISKTKSVIKPKKTTKTKSIIKPKKSSKTKSTIKPKKTKPTKKK